MKKDGIKYGDIVIYPVNPFGECFDYAAQFLMGSPKSTKLCHGIGKATREGEEGYIIAHAWLEFSNGVAFDPIYCVSQPAQEYRANLRVHYIAIYDRKEALELWTKTDYPGPWEEKIKKISEGNNENVCPIR